MAKINKTKLKDEAVHGGNWLYDFIMQTIEPDLLSSTIGTLDEKYAGESATDRNARLFRYKKAFEDFDDLLNLIQDGLTEKAQHQKKQARKKVLDTESVEKSGRVEAMEQEIETFDDQPDA